MVNEMIDYKNLVIDMITDNDSTVSKSVISRIRKWLKLPYTVTVTYKEQEQLILVLKFKRVFSYVQVIRMWDYEVEYELIKMSDSDAVFQTEQRMFTTLDSGKIVVPKIL